MQIGGPVPLYYETLDDESYPLRSDTLSLKVA